MRTLYLLAAGLSPMACGGSGAATPAAAPNPTADSFATHGLSVDRPSGWVFVVPDASVPADTAVVLQGPSSKDPLAAVVEIGRRPLSAAQQRFSRSELLKSIVMEIAQTFDAFETVAGPEDIEVAGKPASRLHVKLTETLASGDEVQRLGRIIGVVAGAEMWVIRCLGPTDGSANNDFDAIVKSLRIGG